ncbi:MAG: MerR family transcriptional regulator [Clostridia bacterium]|nr:MerR family transcriptional regulator [Clostridia bacterium]
MKTVKEVSELTGVSIRTLHYYDEIGLLHPAQITDSGYRLYDDTSLERLQLILFFRELQFPLKDIKGIIESPVFDRNKALDQQIKLLKLHKEHIENLIDLAAGIKLIGVKNLDFKAFDVKKIDEYARQAKASWGNTEAYREFEQKNKDRSIEDNNKLAADMMHYFKVFGQQRELAPESEEVQQTVKDLREFITDNFYNCTPEIFEGLASMYAGGGGLTENIDREGGEGTAQFAHDAIKYYCRKLKES